MVDTLVGQATSPYVLDNVMCNGTEYTLGQCGGDYGFTQCSDPAGVICRERKCRAC